MWLDIPPSPRKANLGKLEITTKEKLTEAEKETLFRWGDDLWDNDRYGLTWCGTDVHFVGYENGAAVTHSGVYLHTLTIGGHDVVLGGLNSVITVPKARGKGYGGQIVGAAEKYMQSQGSIDFGMLFCHPELVAFYGPRGWSAVKGPITIDQPDGPRVTPHTVMVMPFTVAEWLDGPLDLKSFPW